MKGDIPILLDHNKRYSIGRLHMLTEP